MDNFAAGGGYLPAGGIQIFFSIGGFFNKDKFVKFNALQSLLYWIIIILILVFPIVWLQNIEITIGNFYLSALVLILYIVVFLLILPIIFFVKAAENKSFNLPLIGWLSAKIVGYSKEQQ